MKLEAKSRLRGATLIALASGIDHEILACLKDVLPYVEFVKLHDGSTIQGKNKVSLGQATQAAKYLNSDVFAKKGYRMAGSNNHGIWTWTKSGSQFELSWKHDRLEI
jgi:hypothetical protein